MVEDRVNTSNTGYIEAILQICTEEGLDEIDASRLIATPLKSKIEAEAVEFNYIQSESDSRLPV